jgi:hypothetical protein
MEIPIFTKEINKSTVRGKAVHLHSSPSTNTQVINKSLSEQTAARKSTEYTKATKAIQNVTNRALILQSLRRSKYGAKRTEVDGIVFASKREATRYQDLKVMERHGLISGLTLQPKYDLIVEGIKICRYVADFGFIENGAVIIEDCKGFRTPIYRVKRKLMKAIYGITIRET